MTYYKRQKQSEQYSIEQIIKNEITRICKHSRHATLRMFHAILLYI